MKKILIVSDLSIRRFDTTFESIFLFQKKIVQKDIDLKFVLPINPEKEIKKKLDTVGFKYVLFDKWWIKNSKVDRRNIRLAFFVFRLILKERVDLVEFSFCYEITALIVCLLSKLFRLPTKYLWRQHSESRLNEKNNFLFKFKEKLSFIRLLSNFLETIFVLSDKQKKIFIQKGVSAKKIEVIYNGVEINKFSCAFDKNVFLNEIEVDKHKKIITSIASLIPEKGLECLINAAAIVCKKYNDAIFLLVGDGPLLERLRGLTVKNNIETKVKFLGLRNDVPRILNITDIFVHPSLYEAFGMVNIEAMAAAKPVIATNVGGIPEIVTDGETGFLLIPSDANLLAEKILVLLNDETMCLSMGDKGREKVLEEFELSKITDKYVNLYTDMLI